MCLAMVGTKVVCTLPMVTYTMCYNIRPSLADPAVCVLVHILHNLTCVTTPTLFFICSSKFRNSAKTALKKLRVLQRCCFKSVIQIAPHGNNHKYVKFFFSFHMNHSQIHVFKSSLLTINRQQINLHKVIQIYMYIVYYTIFSCLIAASQIKAHP